MSTTPGPLPRDLPPRSSFVGSAFRFLQWASFTVSVGFNVVVVVAVASLLGWGPATGEDAAPRERFLAGKPRAAGKVAVVNIDGVILEGFTSFARRQIETAAADGQVKAVVVRINSPGGSITASDELYHRLCRLRDGDPERGTPPKPLFASMGGLAASGGYYVAVPAQHIAAERTTITGSIGVYAAFPNVAELAQKWGVKMDVVKRGDVKASGSMFHEMTPQERQVWQDMIDHAYDQFLDVVKQGRGDRLKYDLTAEIPEEKQLLTGGPGEAKTVPYVRRLADGGIFTSEKALRYGLIDQIGYLEDAVAVAAKQAGLGSDYRVVTYDRPRSLLSHLLEGRAPTPPLDAAAWSEGLLPRVWYLTPESGLSGFLAAGQKPG
jgi:protease-4